MFMYLLESANIMFLSFIRFELLSFEHGYPISHKMFNIILLHFVNTIKFLSARGNPFPSHLFSTHCVHMWKALLVFMGKT